MPTQDSNQVSTNSNGPNFSMTLTDNDSTQSFINKFASQVYPDGRNLVKSTSAMQKRIRR